MVATLSSFLAIVIGLGLDSAQSYFFFRYSDRGLSKQRELVSSILQLRILWSVLVILFVSLLAPLINHFLFSGELSIIVFLVAFAGTFFVEVNRQFSEVLRLLYKPWKFIQVTISHSLLSSAMILGFTLNSHHKILGFYSATTLSAIVVLFYALFLVHNYIDFSRLYSQYCLDCLSLVFL